MKLYATIDFYDEMCCAVWTPEMLDSYFRNMKEKGISRVYWIDQKEIMMRSGALPHSERMKKSWENFNGALTQAVPRLAHKNGLEIFAVIKPYDLSIIQPALSDELEGVPGIGTAGCRKQYLCTEFARLHQECMLKRQEFPAPGSQAEKFHISFAAPLEKAGSFKVYGSHSNKDYELLSEEILPPGTSFVDVPVPSCRYMVFTLTGTRGGNTLRKIVSALDSEKRPVPFSLALIPGKRYTDIAFHLDSWRKPPPDDGGFRKMGMVFDYLPGIPSSIYSPDAVENEDIFDFADSRENALGVTLELNPVIAGCPDPENACFRSFISEWINEDLGYGYDGIDIRVSNHNSPVFWREYGSGSAVRLARGNAHTALMRELAAQVRSRGKIFALHIANFMFGSIPEKSSPMEFFWDYRRWIAEKICDEVTAKLICADGFSAESLELLELCRKQGIPVNYCPFLHGLENPAAYAAKIASLGADAFNIYESATVWKEYDGEKFLEMDPQQVKLLWQIPGI